MKKTLRVNKIVDSSSTQGIVARTERDEAEVRELARQLAGSTGHLLGDCVEEEGGWYVFDMIDVPDYVEPEATTEPVVEEVDG